MFGLGINKGFISVLCIGYFMVIASICSVQMHILENRVSFYKSLEEFDEFVYIEVLIMHRIKDSFEMKLNEDCTIVYNDYVIMLDYEDNTVIVTYQMMDNEVVREYIYYSECHYLDMKPV